MSAHLRGKCPPLWASYYQDPCAGGLKSPLIIYSQSITCDRDSENDHKSRMCHALGMSQGLPPSCSTAFVRSSKALSPYHHQHWQASLGQLQCYTRQPACPRLATSQAECPQCPQLAQYQPFVPVRTGASHRPPSGGYSQGNATASQRQQGHPSRQQPDPKTLQGLALEDGMLEAEILTSAESPDTSRSQMRIVIVSLAGEEHAMTVYPDDTVGILKRI